MREVFIPQVISDVEAEAFIMHHKEKLETLEDQLYPWGRGNHDSEYQTLKKLKVYKDTYTELCGHVPGDSELLSFQDFGLLLHTWHERINTTETFDEAQLNILSSQMPELTEKFNSKFGVDNIYEIYLEAVSRSNNPRILSTTRISPFLSPDNWHRQQG